MADDLKQIDAVLAAAKSIVSAVQSLDASVRSRALRVAEMLLSERVPFPSVPPQTQPQPQKK